jgi:type VI secretion system protein ImpH
VAPPDVAAGLLSELRRRPDLFTFFQAVRLLLRAAAAARAEGETAVRIRGRADPAAALTELEVRHLDDHFHPDHLPSDGADPIELVFASFGLYGAAGRLSWHYTDLILEQELRPDHRPCPLRAFLDLFNHRLSRLYYDAWETGQLAAGYERSRAGLADPAGPDPFSGRLLGLLLGLPRPPATTRRVLPHWRDEALIWYAGLLAQAPRSATALRQLLMDALGDPITVAAWEGPDGGAALRLVLTIGPLPTLERYEAYLPCGAALPRLLELTGLFVVDSADVELRLRPGPGVAAGCRLNDPRRARLDWTTWLAGPDGALAAPADGCVSAESCLSSPR